MPLQALSEYLLFARISRGSSSQESDRRALASKLVSPASKFADAVSGEDVIGTD